MPMKKVARRIHPKFQLRNACPPHPPTRPRDVRPRGAWHTGRSDPPPRRRRVADRQQPDTCWDVTGGGPSRRGPMRRLGTCGRGALRGVPRKPQLRVCRESLAYFAARSETDAVRVLPMLRDPDCVCVCVSNLERLRPHLPQVD